MAISVRTPKSTREIEPKIVGNFTKRQVICFAIAAAIGAPTYMLTHKTLGTDISVFLMMFVTFPCFFFAMYKRNGMRAEKFLFLVFKQKFLLAGIRPYKAQNIFKEIEERKKLIAEVEELEGKAKRYGIQNKKDKHHSAKTNKKA